MWSSVGVWKVIGILPDGHNYILLANLQAEVSECRWAGKE